MATADWNCDIDVSVTTLDGNGISTDKLGDSSSYFQNRISTSLQNPMPEPSFKRARFSQDSIVNSSNMNGFTNPVDKSTMGWPFRPDLMQIFRSTFDSRFKSSLMANLSAYLARLTSTEEAVESMKKEFKELVDCMEHIKRSSEDLKKMVSERAALPVPSSGVGQRRALSSQAPRQPPQLAPAASEFSSSDAPLDTGTRSLVSPSPSAAPFRSYGATTSVSETQTPSTIPVTVGFATLLGLPLPSQLPTIAPVQTQSECRPAKSTTKSLAVRPMETIDLTVEPSPTASSLEEVVDSVKAKTITSCVSKIVPSSRQGYVNAPCTASASASHASKIAWFAANSVPVTISRTQRAPILHASQLSFRQLQRLPVAPLPPVPFQSTHPFPVQPMPQLTIAEAAEGVCLQWTIGYHSMLFEAATAYEIYSYASSELTTETLFTCLPWKKVGEVAALPLPMACTLTHVQSNNMYYFIVRSVDRYRRYSSWSNVVNAYVG